MAWLESSTVTLQTEGKENSLQVFINENTIYLGPKSGFGRKNEILPPATEVDVTKCFI